MSGCARIIAFGVPKIDGYVLRDTRTNHPIAETYLMTRDIHTGGYGNTEELLSLMRRWEGGRAQVLDFSASHDRLTVWLTKPDSDWIRGDPISGGALLECVRCSDVKFKPVWGPTSIEVSGTPRDGDNEPLILRDADTLLVRCWDAQLTGVFKDFTEMQSWTNP